MLSDYLPYFIRLQRPEERVMAANELAQRCRAESILLFGIDAEVGSFMPAPGMVQTLPQGLRWQAFLEECAASGEHAGTLPDPASKEEVGVLAVCDPERQCIVAFLGGEPDRDSLATIRKLLPLLGPKLADERVIFAASGEATAAREATRRAQALNEALEKSRQELREANLQAEKELVARREIEEKLRETDRRKSEFLAMVSHELRNPLAAINNATHLIGIMGANAPQALAKAYQVIQRQTRHLNHLVNDLLDIARITHDKLTIRCERIPANDCIRDAVESVRSFIDSRGHVLTVRQPQETLWLMGDATRLVQIIDNLLHNAAKYTPQNGEILLDARREGDQLLITVTDNGIGISQDALPNVFSEFFQAEHTSDQVRDGLGIGLTLVKRLVEMHGGKITVASDGSGHGSTFRVALPLVTAHDQ